MGSWIYDWLRSTLFFMETTLVANFFLTDSHQMVLLLHITRPQTIANESSYQTFWLKLQFIIVIFLLRNLQQTDHSFLSSLMSALPNSNKHKDNSKWLLLFFCQRHEFKISFNSMIATRHFIHILHFFVFHIFTTHHFHDFHFIVFQMCFYNFSWSRWIHAAWFRIIIICTNGHVLARCDMLIFSHQ